MTTSESPLLSPRETIIAFNLDMLAAAGCGLVSYGLWPTTYEWWGFGVMSIVMAEAAALSVIGAFKKLQRYHRQKKAVDDFQKGKGQPKSARQPTRERMKEMGMIQ